MQENKNCEGKEERREMKKNMIITSIFMSRVSEKQDDNYNKNNNNDMT